MKPYQIRPGHRHPPGATATDKGINFCIFSRHARSVTLLLYEHPDSSEPFQTVNLDQRINRSFFFWHVLIVGLTGPLSYTWQVDGPGPDELPGTAFNPDQELLDPWARAVTDHFWDRRTNRDPDNPSNPAMRALVTPEPPYDWEGDEPLKQAAEDEIIYELHVGGFTRHHSAAVKHPGTFGGLIEKIPYLQELGITAVELLPVMAFDDQDVPDSVAALGLSNYWGYSTHSFFCPHPGYCINPMSGSHAREFKNLVKALHKAGISVILDVVYNHTAEGGQGGPTINFKGVMNRNFYHLEESDPSRYKNYSGCGNTVNCNHPFTARFILESLEFWVKEFHVDGFRFDLASILARGEDGAPMYHAPVVWNIEFSDTLANTRLIAEAWDAGGLYQVGGFPGYRWAEWNGRYRDLVRQFVGGGGGMIPELATRLAGSSDLYELGGRLPSNSINFITCHDGFTLNDLVSYEKKHNQANGEDNRDGDNHNFSFNCGVEGKSRNRRVLALRRKQARNCIAILLLSQGVPMLLAGDEVLRSQQGNNNGYCQDNELSWFDWGLLEKNQDMFIFTKEMISFRKRHACLRSRYFLKRSRHPGRPFGDITWYTRDLKQPDWSDKDAQFLAFTLSRADMGEEDIHVIINMGSSLEKAALPGGADVRWHLAVDTSRNGAKAVIPAESQRPHHGDTATVRPRSILVFENRWLR
ncbi:MAG: glycogen debranching protein GlgX [Thermodesulfobacteriota bacterium]